MRLSFSSLYKKNSTMEPVNEALFVLLKSAINDGTRDELVNFLCETADEKYLDYVINKITTSIQQFLPMIPEIQSKISNILNLIIGLSEIAVFGLEKSLRLTRCLISMAVDTNCSIYNLKQVLTMLKTFSKDELILEHISTDESLIAPLKLIEKRLPEIGDYECQLSLLEVLWQISSLKRSFYAEWWFDDEHRRTMFLDLNNDQFELGCRTFLNYINEKQNRNRRIFSFIASSVYLGSIQLKEPLRSEFWIDINLDTQSISFFFSSLEIENENTWETIVISSDMVEDYTIQDAVDKRHNKDKVLELCIALKFSCSQLRESEGILIEGLESNLVRIKFESRNEQSTNIPSHIETIFKSNDVGNQAVNAVFRSRKVSDSAEVISQCSEQASASQHTKRKRRASQSTDLVCLSDHQEKAESQISKQRRRASEPKELVSMFNSENEDINVIESTDRILDNDRKTRKYIHRKKVSAGFVDSEEFNQVVHDTNNIREDSEDIFNILDCKNKPNAMLDQKFSDMNDRENENNAESCINDVGQINLSLSMVHNKQSVEICSPNKSLQEYNSVEPQINKGYGKKISEEDYSTRKIINDERTLSKPKRSHNLQLLPVPNITQRKSSQPVENINSKKKALNEHSQSEPKRSQSLMLLTVPDITQRKSSQSVSDLDDTYAISPTPLKNWNNTPFNKLTVKTPKRNKCQSDPTSNQTPFHTGSKPSKSFTKVSSRLSLGMHKHANDCTTPTNISLNDRHKKKRLYNVDQAPMYDVPPSERKNTNDSDGNINTSAVNTFSASQKSASIHNSTNDDNTQHHARTEENTLCDLSKVHCIGVVNATVANDLHLISENTELDPKIHSPEIVYVTKQVQPNTSPEKIENNAISPRQKEKDSVIELETEGNQIHSEMQYDTNQPPTKKSKKVNDRKIRHQVSREISVGSSQEARNASTSNTEPQKQKRHRLSAVTARKMNKLILEQKGSETSFEESQQGKQQNKDSGFSQETDEYDVFLALPSSSMEKEIFPHKKKVFESDENEDVFQSNTRSGKRCKSAKKGDKSSSKLDEYEFCTTPPNVKRRHRSVFVTDTETGSSEVSWFHKQPKLFETPKKFYSNRKKIKKATNMTKRGKAKMRTAKPISNTKRKFSQRSKTSDSETRSKSALSELDNFNLVVEKNASHKPLPANDLSGLYHALESDRNVKQSIIEDDNPTQDNPFAELDVLNENEKSFEIDGDHDFLTEVSEHSAANVSLRTSVKKKNKSDQSSTGNEIPDVRIKHNSLPQNKNTKFANCSIMGEDNFFSKESTKRKRKSTNSFMELNSKRNKSFIDIDYTNLDTITGTKEQFHKLKAELHHGTKKSMTKSITKNQSKSNKDPNDIEVNLPILSETVNGVSLFDVKSGAVVSKRKIVSKNSLEKRTESPLKHKNALTEECLNSYNDEEKGKQMHLERYFESLSSASTNPQDLGISDIRDVSPAVKKSRSKLSKEKLREEKSFYDEYSVVDQLTPYKMPSSENCKLDSDMGKKRWVANSSLLGKDVLQITEEEFEKDVSNKDPFKSPLLTSTPLVRKEASNDKMFCDGLLMNPSVMHILSDEVNNLTHKLFSTLKRCMADFREKMAALRESIVNAADTMIANESKFTDKDLQILIRNCRESRIHIQRNLKKLYTLGNEYFEAEKRHERRFAKKHRKAVIKYTKSLQLAKSIAEKALEERFIFKSRAFFKTFIKQMKLV